MTPHAVPEIEFVVLTTILTGHDQDEIDQRLRDATRPPGR